MSLDVLLCYFLLRQIAVQVADDPTDVERYLEVRVASIDQRCVSVVCRHPWIVPPNIDVWSSAVKPVFSIESNRIRDLGLRLRSVGVVL